MEYTKGTTKNISKPMRLLRKLQKALPTSSLLTIYKTL